MSRGVEPGLSPQRVVSLVPSITDSMVTLGLGNRLVGVTDYGRGLEILAGIPRVGGPKDARIDEIAGLHPDIVFAGEEENPEPLIEALEQSGLKVWVTFPKTVRQAVSDLRDLAMMYPSENALQSVVWLDRAVDWLEGASPPIRVRVFCPIGREGPADKPERWISMNGDTYASDLLFLCGAENVFAGRTDSRYPPVTPEEVAAADPEFILLPDEPFAFQEEDESGLARNLPMVRAVQRKKIRRMDGRLLFWHGTRLGESIRVLPEYFKP